MAKRITEWRWVVVALPAVLLLSGCAHFTNVIGPQPTVDREAVRLNADLADHARNFYATLPAKTAPDCSFENNRASYAAMRESASAIQARAAAAPRDDAMRRDAAALSKLVDAAERSHQRASANIADRFGACMAPAAIELNADAVARATAKVDALQQARRP